MKFVKNNAKIIKYCGSIIKYINNKNKTRYIIINTTETIIVWIRKNKSNLYMIWKKQKKRYKYYNKANYQYNKTNIKILFIEFYLTIFYLWFIYYYIFFVDFGF